MRPQTLFNRVVRHLLRQNKRAMQNGSCMYRTDEGYKCAIGGVLPDSLYQPKLEGRGYTGLIDSGQVGVIATKIEKYFGKDNQQLAAALQSVHDFSTPCCWLDELKRIARDYKLAWPLVNKLKVVGMRKAGRFYVVGERARKDMGTELFWLTKSGTFLYESELGGKDTEKLCYWKDRKECIKRAKGYAEVVEDATY